MTEEEKNQLSICKEQGLPDHAELIDDTFYVWKTRFGLYATMTKKGRKMLTALEKEGAVIMTRWHLKCEQEGWPEGSVRVINSGFVGGKL